MAQTRAEKTAYQIERDNELVACSQCGQFSIKQITISKRLARGSDEKRCSDCLARPSEYLKYGNMTCKPWHGEFDWEQMVPIKDGRPYRPGFRKCLHADCVAKDHIIVPDSYESQRSSLVREMYVKTGKLISLEQADRILEGIN